MKRKTKVKILNSAMLIILLSTLFIAVKNVCYDDIIDNYYQSNYKGSKSTNNNLTGISYLEQLAKSNPKINTIIQNKNDYPEILLDMLARNLDMTDYVLGYPDSKGKVSSNNIGKVTKGKFPLLLQYDQRWGYGIYGDDVIAIPGCVPTSLAMVIAGLTGRNDITPYDVALYAYENGYYEGGTSWSFFTKGVKHYGIIGKELPLAKNQMIIELEQNHPIICSMRKGDFTTTGHIIVITGMKNGKFIINDPNSKERSSILYSYEQIESQIKNLWPFQLE